MKFIFVICLLLFGVVSVAEIYISRKFYDQVDEICNTSFINNNFNKYFYSNYTEVCDIFSKTDKEWHYKMNFENLSKLNY